MTGDELLRHLGEKAFVTVKTKSGNLYYLERDVITSNAHEPKPFLYGWPTKKKPRQKNKPQWFFVENIEIYEENMNVQI